MPGNVFSNPAGESGSIAWAWLSTSASPVTVSCSDMADVRIRPYCALAHRVVVVQLSSLYRGFTNGELPGVGKEPSKRPVTVPG